MSAPQGNHACRITVDPSTADVLRIEAKKVLMFNHEPFEDFLHKRRCDLLDTNLDLLTDIGADQRANAIILTDIHANRHSVEALNRILDAYSNTITN